ncbi:hypothetical protein [Pelosinus fermentans]|uniref:Uncharacterized protein n=1 Tax=Pelosinus fermentans JBW45 TaxID=1192197 RepID=I8TXF0_9FIRM|nr:hypothetical protein [Pelosinus fermentans]AJQ28018.1 hypothetical protein JBW_02674 [Pelosinus fermentans JBW45]
MKRWRLLVLAFLAAFCLNSYVFASYSPNLEERPIAFDPGKSMGYFLWQDKEGLHLRITSTGIPHTFSGTVRTDGRFENVLGKYQGGNEDYFEVNKSQNKIIYNFTTAKDEEGLDFQLSYGSYVKFSLSLDGESIDSEQIFIGKDGWHPARYEFTLRQDGEHLKYADGEKVVIIGGGFWWPRGDGHR